MVLHDDELPLPCLAMALASGCLPKPEVAPRRVLTAPRNEIPSSPIHLAFDFGDVISDGHKLEHVFFISNHGNQLSGLRAVPRSPCCTRVRPLPECVPQNAAFPVKVTFLTEGRSGPSEAHVDILTSEAPTHSWTLTLRADLHPRWQVVRLARSRPSVVLGSDRTIDYLIVTHRLDSDPPLLPCRVQAGPRLELDTLGSVQATRLRNGLVRESQELRIRALGQPRPGEASADLTLLLADGQRRSHEVFWHVSGRIEAVPAGIVIRGERRAQRVAVLLRSHVEPIRILGVEGPVITETTDLPSETRSSHVIPLEIDPDRIGTSGLGEIRVRTSDPLQPEVVLTVARLASFPEAVP
jgi:hypothetical protein